MGLLKIILRKILSEGIINTIKMTPRLKEHVRTRRTYKKMLREASIQTRFNIIYKNNLWGSNESVSGGGSEIEYTKMLRSWLIDAVLRYKISSIVDAPCGDFNWMRLVIPKTNIQYFGYDIVENIINENAAKFKSPVTHFEVKNILEDSLPACDLLLVRDFLLHLSFADINKFLKNISRVNYKYILTTSNNVDQNFKNIDIKTGDARLINIFRSPLNFRREFVIESIRDYPDGFNIPRSMILMAKEDVPVEIM